MKRMVVVGIIATLILLAMVGVASAYGVKVDKVTVNGGNPSNTTVGYTSDTFFYVVFDVTSGGDTHNQVLYFTTNLTITTNNLSKIYDPYPSQMRNIVTNKTCPLPQPPTTKIETGKYEVRFEPIRFYDFGIEVAKIAEVKYNISFEYNLGRDHKNDSVSGHGPRVFPPEPEIIKGIPQKIYLYYLDNLEVEFCVNDVMGNRGTATLKAYKPPHYNGTPQFEEPGERSYQGGDEYCHTWKIEQKRHHNFTSADEDKIFKLCVDYDPVYYKIYPNWSCGWLQVTEYIPKIIADLGPYSKEGTRQKLSEEDWKKIYVERDDLHGNFRFNATIEDERGKGTAILEVCGVNDSVGCKRYTLAGPSEGIYHQYANESIRFNKGNFSLRLYYNRSNLPPWWPCPSKPWKVYNITIFPFSINFTNAIVSPPSGSGNDTFNYSVDVKNASKDLPITLRVFDPYREREPWVYRGAPDIKEPPTFKWTDRRPCEKYCAGESKFYFEYRIEEYQGESQVFFGPELIKPPPEFDNDSVDPNVTIYCNWSKSSTPCNYSVNVTAEDEYKVTLLVKDPTDKKWIPKEGIRDVSSETKNPVTWYGIKPFESLNIENITQYIDNETRANYTFESDGHKANKNFSGPLLVGAFKEPRIVPDPENISYGDTFSYSVNVTGSEKLNITLRYLCDGKWISDNITEPTTKEYTNITKWEQLNWTCKAINTWEDVKFDVIVTGEEIEVY